MGNGFDHQSIHKHHHFHQKTIFLPLFCRLSIKDIKLNYHRKSPISTDDDEPSSPKVSCMGQVKRSNRVIGFPTTNAVTTHTHRYSRLKKLFSSKTLLPPTTTSMPTTTQGGTVSGGGRSGSKSCRNIREMTLAQTQKNSRRLNLKNDGDKCDQDCVGLVNVGELDPPLPVVKRVAASGVDRDEVNLWKRRSKGAALKSLQIEQIHLRKSSSQPPTV
ncbi:uncharacterized protein LOC105159505 [Sesamum indicum]|uniref:Uncharacterized protein LOC105159505 n=1 Tax=Sesamum indicum TaxID=4182 RepID=A0A6I9SZ29_SESIN|nr:uncharacterized protein LOC105159505 [Sesamum indicum]